MNARAKPNPNPNTQWNVIFLPNARASHRSGLTDVYATKVAEKLDGKERWRTVEERAPECRSGKLLRFVFVQKGNCNVNDPEQKPGSKRE